MNQEETHHHLPPTEDGPSPPRSFPGQKKVERIAEQSRGLFDDVKGWVELRIQLARLEIKKELEDRRDDAVMGGVIGFLGVIALVFLLIATALGVGAVLGHPAWGFLVVTGVLVLAAWMLWYVHFGRRRPHRPTKQLPAGPSNAKRLPPATGQSATNEAMHDA